MNLLNIKKGYIYKWNQMLINGIFWEVINYPLYMLTSLIVYLKLIRAKRIQTGRHWHPVSHAQISNIERGGGKHVFSNVSFNIILSIKRFSSHEKMSTLSPRIS